MGYHTAFFQQNWLPQAREAEASTQAPTFAQPAVLVVIATQQTEASFTFTQPATVPAVPTQPSVPMSNQTQRPSGYCAICTPARKQCPKEYTMPLKSGKKESIKENKVGEEVEDRDGNSQKQKVLKE